MDDVYNPSTIEEDKLILREEKSSTVSDKGSIMSSAINDEGSHMDAPMLSPKSINNDRFYDDIDETGKIAFNFVTEEAYSYQPT